MLRKRYVMKNVDNGDHFIEGRNYLICSVRELLVDVSE